MSMGALGRKLSLLLVAVSIVRCGRGDGPAPELPGDPVDLGPREGDVLAVVGIAHDDVLRLRVAPGEDQATLTTMASTEAGLVARGRARSVPGALWILVDRGGTLGWVNLRDIAYIGDTIRRHRGQAACPR